VTGPLAPPALPRGTVPGLSTPSPAGGDLGNLFPQVTPAPTAPGGVRAHLGPLGTGGATALTAETGVIGHAQSAAITLAVTIAAGLAAVGLWLVTAGPARRAVLSMAHRRGRHTRER
jgi:hypothetical protein